MTIGVLKEQVFRRVSITPDVAGKLISDECQVLVEHDAGSRSNFTNEQYEAVGARLTARKQILKECDVLLSIAPVFSEEISLISGSCLMFAQFQPFVPATNLTSFLKNGISAVSLDMIPRSTIAQSMDVLSSMASLSGYKGVILAANYLPKYFPMLTTAAGAIPPAKVLVIGAGVAGLQAIATAKRLGAVVEAFDTRTIAKEEVESLGAKFVQVEGALDDHSAGGYAVAQTDDYRNRQQKLVAERARISDVIITTAQVRGAKAPRIITAETVSQMKAGSVIVDLAASTGGNCELTRDRQTIIHNGVTIIGNSELSDELPNHASVMYAKNVLNLLNIYLPGGTIEIDKNNDIISSSLIIEDGEIRYKK